MEPHAKPKLDIPKWSALLVEAVNKPGLIMKAYTSFHNYSLSNRLLSLVQCQWRYVGFGLGQSIRSPDGRH